MDMESQIKSQLLEQLMGEMEDHQASSYRKPGQEPALVASKEEVKVEPAPEGEEEKVQLKKLMGIDPEMKQKTYMDPQRQKVIEQVEDESASLPPSFSQFSKSRKG